MAESSAGVAGLKIIKFFVWLVYALATAAIIVLSFGFVLLLFDANPANDFAAFIMRWGSTFAKPFIGLIEPTPLGNGGAVAWSLLFAIAVYAILAWLVGMALDSISRSIYRNRSTAPVQPQPVAQVVQPVAQVVQPVAPVAPTPVAPEAVPEAPPVPEAPASAPEPTAAEATPEPSAEPADIAPEAEAPAPVDAPTEAPPQPEAPSAD